MDEQLEDLDIAGLQFRVRDRRLPPLGHRRSMSEGYRNYFCIPHDAVADLSTGEQGILYRTKIISNTNRGHHKRTFGGSIDHGRIGLHSAPGSFRGNPYISPVASPPLESASCRPLLLTQGQI